MISWQLCLKGPIQFMLTLYRILIHPIHQLFKTVSWKRFATQNISPQSWDPLYIKLIWQIFARCFWNGEGRKGWGRMGATTWRHALGLSFANCRVQMSRGPAPTRNSSYPVPRNGRRSTLCGPSLTKLGFMEQEIQRTCRRAVFCMFSCNEPRLGSIVSGLHAHAGLSGCGTVHSPLKLSLESP